MENRISAEWNWNTWRATGNRYYTNASQYYGVVASNVDIHMYDFVFKLEDDLAVSKFYKGVDVDEKSLIWHLKGEDIMPKRTSPEHLKIHPEPVPRKCKKSPSDSSDRISLPAEKTIVDDKASDSPKTWNVAKLQEKMAFLREKAHQASLSLETKSEAEQQIPEAKLESVEVKSEKSESIDQPEEEPVKIEEEVTLISRSEVRRRKSPKKDKEVTVISPVLPVASLPRFRVPRNRSIFVPIPSFARRSIMPVSLITPDITPILIDDIVDVTSPKSVRRLQHRRKERERIRRESRIKERILKDRKEKEQRREKEENALRELREKERLEKEQREALEKETKERMERERRDRKEERQRESEAAESEIHREMKRRRKEQKLQRKVEREQRRMNKKARKLRRGKKLERKDKVRRRSCSSENYVGKREKQKEDSSIVVPRGRGTVHFRYSSPSSASRELSPSLSTASQSSVSIELEPRRTSKTVYGSSSNPFDAASDIMNRPVKDVVKKLFIAYPYQSSSTRSDERCSQSNTRSTKQTSSSESGERSLSRVRKPFDSPRNRRVRNPFDSPRIRRSESNEATAKARKRVLSQEILRGEYRSPRRQRQRLRN